MSKPMKVKSADEFVTAYIDDLKDELKMLDLDKVWSRLVAALDESDWEMRGAGPTGVRIYGELIALFVDNLRATKHPIRLGFLISRVQSDVKELEKYVLACGKRIKERGSDEGMRIAYEKMRGMAADARVWRDSLLSLRKELYDNIEDA